MKRIRPLTVVVVFMALVPFVALAVLAGAIASWRVPAAIGAAMGLLYARSRMPTSPGGRIRATAEFIDFAFVGSIIGGFALGGVGAIFGFALGFTARLAEVPVSGVVRRGMRQ